MLFENQTVIKYFFKLNQSFKTKIFSLVHIFYIKLFNLCLSVSVSFSVVHKNSSF